MSRPRAPSPLPASDDVILTEDWRAWSREEAATWARRVLTAFAFRPAVVAAAVSTLEAQEIIGSVLPLLTTADLMQLGLPCGVAKVLTYSIARLRAFASEPGGLCTALDASDAVISKRPGLSFLVDPGAGMGDASDSSSSGDVVVKAAHRLHAIRAGLAPVQVTDSGVHEEAEGHADGESAHVGSVGWPRCWMRCHWCGRGRLFALCVRSEYVCVGATCVCVCACVWCGVVWCV